MPGLPDSSKVLPVVRAGCLPDWAGAGVGAGDWGGHPGNYSPPPAQLMPSYHR